MTGYYSFYTFDYDVARKFGYEAIFQRISKWSKEELERNLSRKAPYEFVTVNTPDNEAAIRRLICLAEKLGMKSRLLHPEPSHK